jgi:hypothetical protein
MREMKSFFCFLCISICESNAHKHKFYSLWFILRDKIHNF